MRRSHRARIERLGRLRIHIVSPSWSSVFINSCCRCDCCYPQVDIERRRSAPLSSFVINSPFLFYCKKTQHILNETYIALHGFSASALLHINCRRHTHKKQNISHNPLSNLSILLGFLGFLGVTGIKCALI